MGKPKIVKILQWLHLTIFLICVGMIFLLHYFPNDFLDFFRLPTFLKDIDPLLGFGWPASLHIYQVVLVFALFIIFVDALGLFFYSSKFWRLVSDVSSFLGFLVIWPVGLFFLYSLATLDSPKIENIQTIFIYLALSFVLFFLDLVTWFVDEQSLLKFTKDG